MRWPRAGGRFQTALDKSGFAAKAMHPDGGRYQGAIGRTAAWLARIMTNTWRRKS